MTLQEGEHQEKVTGWLGTTPQALAPPTGSKVAALAL